MFLTSVHKHLHRETLTSTPIAVSMAIDHIRSITGAQAERETRSQTTRSTINTRTRLLHRFV